MSSLTYITKQIRIAMIDKNLSVDEIAAKLAVTPQYISAVINLKAENIKRLFEVCKLLGLI